MNSQKQMYYQQDMQDWCEFAGMEMRFPDVFPLRSVLPLRATLASKCDPALIRTLCEFSTSLSDSVPLLQCTTTFWWCFYERFSLHHITVYTQASQQHDCHTYIQYIIQSLTFLKSSWLSTHNSHTYPLPRLEHTSMIAMSVCMIICRSDSPAVYTI